MGKLEKENLYFFFNNPIIYVLFIFILVFIWRASPVLSSDYELILDFKYMHKVMSVIFCKNILSKNFKVAV